MNLLEHLNTALAGWDRHERTVMDHPHLTDTWWTRDHEIVRHVADDTHTCLLAASLNGVLMPLDPADPDVLAVLADLIGDGDG